MQRPSSVWKDLIDLIVVFATIVAGFVFGSNIVRWLS
jgi:hypothetical protein